MKIADVIMKTAKEQYRSLWILLLTVIMAPFFVFVYYLINESSKPSYDILILNLDKGVFIENTQINHGDSLVSGAGNITLVQPGIPLHIRAVPDTNTAISTLRNKKADVLLVIPEGFSDSLETGLKERRYRAPEIALTGDMTDFNYMISAIWGSEIVRVYIEHYSGLSSPFTIKESNLSQTSGSDEFSLYMPGLFVLSIVMLMFSASISIVTEIEQGTILRFRLSGLTSFEFIGGVAVVQVIIGFLSVGLTLGTACLLGFHSGGPAWLSCLVICLVSLSIIAFSVILAALTKSSNEILVAGNFPLFLFMFFTGAAFPMEGKALVSIGGYGLNLQSLMSPTHGVLALKKIMLLDSGIKDVIPELIALLGLTLVYFSIGLWLFNKRHLR